MIRKCPLAVLIFLVLPLLNTLNGQQQPGIQLLFSCGLSDPLSDQVEWQLKDGSILRGKLHLRSVDEDFVVIRNESRQELVVPINEFENSDHEVINKLVAPLRNSPYRIRDALASPIPWKESPKSEYKGLRLLAIEQDRLIGTEFGRVYAIDRGLVDSDKLLAAQNEWEARFESGKFRSFEFKNFLPSQPFVGRPIAITKTNVLFEIPASFGLDPSIVRVPQFIFSEAQFAGINQQVAEVAEQYKFDETTIFEIPCLRRIPGNWCIARAMSGLQLEASQGKGFQPNHPMQLQLEDRIDFILNNNRQHLILQEIDKLDFQSPVLRTLLEEKRSPYANWALRSSILPINGGVIGKWEGRFVFRLRDGSSVLIPSNQLAPLDSLIAEKLAQGMNESWSKDIDLEKLSVSRLFSNQMQQVQQVLGEQSSKAVLGDRIPIVSSEGIRQNLNGVLLYEFKEALEILTNGSKRSMPLQMQSAAKNPEAAEPSKPTLGDAKKHAIEKVSKIGVSTVSAGERSWQLTNGLVVTGSINASELPHYVVVSNHQGDLPQQVLVDLKLFTAQDRDDLNQFKLAVDTFAFMEYLPSLEVKIRWKSGVPIGLASELTNVVYLDDKKVFGIVNSDLVAVPRDAITSDCLMEMENKFRDLGSGRNLIIHRGLPRSIAGKPVFEDDTCFVLETGPLGTDPAMGPTERQPLRFSGVAPIVLPPSTKIRMPKYLITEEMIATIKSGVDFVKGGPTSTILTPDEIRSLPCVRRMGDELVCCLSASQANQTEIEILRQWAGSRELRKEKYPASTIFCRDQWEWEKESLDREGDIAELNERALERVAASSLTRRNWSLKNANRSMDGKLTGAVADGFVFEHTDGVYFFVKADELADIDLSVCSLLEPYLDPTWPDKVDFEKLFRSRVVLCAGRPIHTYLGEKRTLQGCVNGSFPKLHFLSNPTSPIGESFIHAESLQSVQSAMSFVESHSKLWAEVDPSKIVAKLDEHRGNRPIARDKAIPVQRQPERWAMRDGREFQAVLEGEFESDFVFQSVINGKPVSFLVAKEGLAPTIATRAQAIVARLRKQDWPNIVARAKNWQYYRIWYEDAKYSFRGMSPVVVDSIGENSIVFQKVEGGIDTSFVEAGKGYEDRVSVYSKAVASGLKLRQETAVKRGLTPWAFRECSEILYAKVIGHTDDRVLMVDVDNVEFLIGKACFNATGRERIEAIVRSDSNLRKLDPNEADVCNYLWCGRTKLDGLGRPIYLSSDGKLYYQNPDEMIEELQIAKLTLRDRLSVEYLMKRRSLSPASSGKPSNIESHVIDKDIIRHTPALTAKIKSSLDEATKWELLVWSSKPVKLDTTATVLAVNGSVTSAVIQAGLDSWNIVDLESGKQSPVHNIPKEILGPWMSATSNKLWWIENGLLIEWDDQTDRRDAKLQLPKLIVAACQSGDFSTLLLSLEDRSLYRVELSTMKHELLSGASQNSEHASSDRLWASIDGSAALRMSGNVSNYFGRKSADGKFLGNSAYSEGLGKQDLKPQLEIRHVAVGNEFALSGGDSTNRFLLQYAAPRNIQPSVVALQLQPTWLGFVDLYGKEHKESYLRYENESREVVQSIGLPSEDQSVTSNYLLVHQAVPRGDQRRFAHQIIEGVWTENSKMGANGAALLHQQSGKFVVSYRPAKIPEALRYVVARHVTKLVADRDIGQLEALARHLELPQFMKDGPYRGHLADSFHDSVRICAMKFEADLPGDHLDRAVDLANHFHEKFPTSQVAMNLQVNLYRAIAWDARGSGYAGTVTDLGLDSFKSNMSEAQTVLDKLLALEPTMAQSYSSAIDVAMATGQSLDDTRKMANRIIDGSHRENIGLHFSIAFLLLPRWHGSPGMSESYITNVSNRIGGENGDAIYAQLIQKLSIAYGMTTPVSKNLKVDFDRLIRGTKAYYKTHDDSQLLQGVETILSLERKKKWLEELRQLRIQKRLL